MRPAPAWCRAAVAFAATSAILVAVVPPAGAAGNPDPAHDSRNALDWAGTYEGDLPCADCPGIRTRLTLGRDGRFELTSRYVERAVAPRTESGAFRWNDAGNTVTLEGAGGGQRFRVGEGRLVLLDPDGAMPGWDAPNRVLTKTAAVPADAAQGPTADVALARTLQDHRWTLTSAVDAAGKPVGGLVLSGRAFVVRFEGARVAVQGACNTMNGRWQLDAGAGLDVGRLASTMKACEASWMEADRAFAAFLAQPVQASVEPGTAATLRLVSAEGTTLSFAGERTPRSLYGEPTRIFLEVAPERVACTPSPMPTTTCLHVRELHFDDKGLPSAEPGPWRPYYGNIEGFTHQPGVRTVLRIDRYVRPRPPADASSYVDVLDMVVQSEIVRKT